MPKNYNTFHRDMRLQERREHEADQGRNRGCGVGRADAKPVHLGGCTEGAHAEVPPGAAHTPVPA